MRQSVIRLLALGWMVLGLWWGVQAAAQTQEAPPGGPGADAGANQRLITMDFQDVDLNVLVKFISEITGKNFIIDEKVRGKVTIISPAKISVDEAYLVFQSVLQVKGFTTVNAGSVIKIVPTKEAKSSTLETVLPSGRPAPTDEYITRLVPLKHVDANNMVGILQPLVSPDGLLAAYAATNTLIIIDTAAQTDRLVKILGELDVEGFEQGIEVIRLNYAFATDIAALLQQVLEDQGGGGAAAPAAAVQPGQAPDARVRRGARAPAPGGAGGTISGGATPERAFKIIPDERTNSLILLAGPPEMRRIKDLINRLDVPLPLGTGRIHVYYLKYANAFEMTAVLGSLLGGSSVGGLGAVGGLGGVGAVGGLAGRNIAGLTGGRSGLGSRGGGGFGGGGLGGFGGAGFGGGFGGVSGGFGQTGLGAAGNLAGRGGFGGLGGIGGGLTRAERVGGTGTIGQGGGEFESAVRLTADPATNALIINASPQDFETLKEVIDKLDVRRRQVYVEAIIAEVTLDRTRELGIELQGATSLDNGVGVGRTNLTGDINQLLTPANLSGLVLAAASSQTITVNGVTLPAQQILLRALQRDSNANILSAPTVLTTDNQEAEIVSGQNVPFIASRSTSEVNLANTFATVERRDVGITLRITPQISEGGTLRLDIFEEVSDVISNDPQLGPTTTIRSATTTVVAKDGQTVVIGGLISDAAVKSETKVPFIGDIPVIGNFFRSNQYRNRKLNLLVFLTPHIIRSEREQRNISVAERDRLIRRPFEKRGLRGPNWEELYAPSWEIRPSLEPSEEGAAPQATPETDHQPLHEERLSEAPRYEERNEAAASASMTDRYILFATIWESGTPLPSLKSSNGLLALAVPANGALAALYRKGEGYSFRSDGYAANYECLEVFATPQEAFATYPEGMLVSSDPQTFLHWREPTEATTLSPSNWTQAN